MKELDTLSQRRRSMLDMNSSIQKQENNESDTDLNPSSSKDMLQLPFEMLLKESRYNKLDTSINNPKDEEGVACFTFKPTSIDSTVTSKAAWYGDSLTSLEGVAKQVQTASVDIAQRQLKSNELGNQLSIINTFELTDQESETLAQTYNAMLEQSPIALSGSLMPSISSGVSITDKEICSAIVDIITTMDTSYLSIYEQASQAMMKLFQGWTDISQKLPDYISTDKDKIKFDANSLWTCCLDYISEVSRSSDFILYGPVSSKEDAEKWAKEFGGDGMATVVEVLVDYEYKYKIIPNLDPILAIADELNSLITKHSGDVIKISTTEYQAWLTGYNTQCDNIKTNTQILMTKHNTANSTYDAILKLLMSTISELRDSLISSIRNF